MKNVEVINNIRKSLKLNSGLVKKIILVLLLSLNLVFYQNCNEQEFSETSQGAFFDKCTEDARFSKKCPNYGFSKDIIRHNTNPTDILFVLDDSCSMQNIANQVRDGFKSIEDSNFPDNTLMALTYMSPSNVLADGQVDYSQAWMGLSNVNTRKIIKMSPGHMDLVSRSKISEFKSLRDNLTYEGNYGIDINDFIALFPNIDFNNSANGIRKNSSGTRLTLTANSNPSATVGSRFYDTQILNLKACDKQWFGPNETNSDGKSCLDGVTQLLNLCTGVEAGLISLEQMINLKTSRGEKLFRDRSFVNIVLVSDTHEAGADYFGQPGAPSSMSSLEQIQSAIYRNNPSVSSVKINGIVPLPPVGDVKLEGLNTVGQIPASLIESKVGSEDLFDFSYLPYIKGSGGVAAHAANSDWSEIASKIIDESNYTGQVVVKLLEPAKVIYEVKINGDVVDQENVILSADRKRLYIKYRSLKNININTEVEYMKDIIF